MKATSENSFDDFGEEDSDEITSPDAKEMKLATQSYDLSINTLLEQWNDGTLQLPEIQREYVWDNGRASRLVESILLNIPIPVVYFSETEEVQYLIIDGHQRILSIVRYIRNDFPLSGLKILGPLTGKRFNQLPAREQRLLRTRVIRAIIIGADSDDLMKFEVFERLNTGSIALNAQEIRNSTHRGPMNELIRTLVLDKSFRSCIGTTKPRPRFSDNELILRYFALSAGWKSYRPPLKKLLNDYLTKANGYSTSEHFALESDFRNVATLLHAVIGKGAFRVTDSHGQPIDRAVNRALAETQLVTFSWIQNPDFVKQNAKAVVKALGECHASEEFLDTIRRATGDRRRTLRRLQMYIDALRSSGAVMVHKSVFDEA